MQSFLDELNADKFDHVIVDLGELTFINSTGMSVAYRLDRWGREPGRSLVFTRPIPDVLHKLEVAGLAEQSASLSQTTTPPRQHQAGARLLDAAIAFPGGFSPHTRVHKCWRRCAG